MDVSWQNLPCDIMHHILKFDGRIVYRNGQYIPRISPADPRYDILHKIPAKTYKLYRSFEGIVGFCITRIVIPPTKSCSTTLHLDIRIDNDKSYVEYFTWCSNTLKFNRSFLY